MKTQRMIRWMLAVAVALALAALTVLLVALPTAAGPTAQEWTPIPPATPYPVDEVIYQLDAVGGDASPQVFPAQEVDGVTFGETTVTTEFPLRLYFSADVTTDREIDQIQLMIWYNNGASKYYQAFWQDDTAQWRALWLLGLQIPAWAEFEFQWCLLDAADETVCTDRQPITLVDPNQVWNRVTTDYAMLYWYGFGEDQREDIARQFTRAVTSTHPRLVEGFGREISHKPIVVVYPDGESSHQSLSWGLDDGHTQNDATLGMSVQVLAPVKIDDEVSSCPYFSSSGEWSMDERLNMMYADATWNIPTLFSGDILRGPVPTAAVGGPSWTMNIGPWFWAFGQGRWFSIPDPYYTSYDQRLHQLTALQEIPKLSTIRWDNLMAADGCGRLIDDVGASFINWLVFNYGIETHRQIVELMTPTDTNPVGMSFERAIQQATGKPFAELENEWRAYLELPPLE